MASVWCPRVEWSWQESLRISEEAVMDTVERRSVPGWMSVPLFVLIFVLGSSFNCVCWEDDEHDWCEEHDCDDDAEGGDDDDTGSAGDDDDDDTEGDDDTKFKPPTDDDTGDDDDLVGDDDDTTGSAGDDDDTVGDDDDTLGNPFDCDDFCDMEQGFCVDWTGSGMTCMEFCVGCLTPDALDCLALCPADPLSDSCACVYNCISAWIVP